MIILSIRTDKPEAEISLFNSKEQIANITWPAHRELSDTLMPKIELLLDGKPLASVDGIAVYQGPGSFTGLRIGITVANTLSYSLSVPIVATQGEQWLDKAMARLINGEKDTQALPFYGAEANITKPRK